MKPAFDLSLYLVTDSSYHDEPEFLRRVDLACQGGVTLLQLREKECSSREYYQLACKVKEIADRYGIPLMIDDRVDIAQACGAAGVHLGAADLPVSVARKILGPDKIIGATAKTVPWAADEAAQGADYLGVGAMFPTATKPDASTVPLDVLRDICQAVSVPVVAIGGIGKANLPQLSKTGVDGVALVSAIFAAEDIEQECRELRTLSEQMVEAGKAHAAAGTA